MALRPAQHLFPRFGDLLSVPWGVGHARTGVSPQPQARALCVCEAHNWILTHTHTHKHKQDAGECCEA